MGSDDEFDMLPVKRRGPPITKVNNGVDTSPVGDFHVQLKSGGTVNPLGLNDDNEDDADIILPVKHRGAPVQNINGLSRYSDPYDNVQTKKKQNENDRTSGNNGLYSQAMMSNDLNQVNCQEPHTKVNNGLDNVPIKISYNENPKLANIDPDLLKHRGDLENLNKLGEDPFCSIPTEVLCGDRSNHPQEINPIKMNSNETNNGLSDVLQNEMLYNPLVNVFDRMDLTDTTKKISIEMPVDNFLNESGNVCADQHDFLACQQPVTRKTKGVSFDFQTIDPNLKTKFEFPSNDTASCDTDFRLGSSSNVCNQAQAGNFDEMFQPIQTSDFIDGLDFLEQCGGNGTEAMEQLQRKSLYVRFDPLCKIKDSVKQSNSIEKGSNFINKPAVVDLNPAKEVPSLDELSPNSVSEKFPDKTLHSSFDYPFSAVTNCVSLKVDKDQKDTVNNANSIMNGEYPVNKLVCCNVNGKSLSSLDENFTDNNLLSSSFGDPFSPVNKHCGPSKIANELKELYPKVKSALNTPGLVEPLLYTQSDMDEVIKKAQFNFDDDVNAREIDWQKKYGELECKIKEEIVMRELIEQDHRGKIECLRNDNLGMKQVLTQYEKTIVELTENSHHDNKSNEETLAETIRSKEQLQEDLNNAEQNIFDAYKRIEKLKQTIDAYKRNEDNLKENSAEVTSKLQKSEDRYAKLGEHAREKIDVANALISKVRKQQEVDLAGLQAALKKAQNRVNNLELEIQQKNIENQQLSQICDDLIKKVSGE